MDTKRFILGTVVSGVVLFVGGYLVFGLLLADFFAGNAGSATGVARDPMLYWAIALGCLGEAALISHLLGANGGAGAGARAGGIVGFLLWLSADFVLYGTQNVSNLTATVVDPLVSAVVAAVAGAVAGAVVGKARQA